MEVLLTIICVFLGLIYVYKLLQPRDRKALPPGPNGYPLVGSMLQLDPERIHENFYELAKINGDIFQIQIFGSNTVVLNSLDFINKAFTGDVFRDIFNDRPHIYFGDQFYFGSQSISFRNIDKDHANLRKSFVKGLHVYGDGIPKFEEIVKNELNRIMTEIEQSDENGFEVVGFTRRSLCNIMSMLLIGQEATRGDEDDFLDFAYSEAYFLNPLINTLLFRIPFLRYVPRYKNVLSKAARSKRNILDKYFIAMKETFEPDTVRGLVDYFISEQWKDLADSKEPTMTDDKIQVMVLDVISAGILTTSTVLPSAIQCLINHPKYQIKLQQELDRVVGKDTDPCVDDRTYCVFLEAVVMETMRYITPTPLLLPHVCTKDVKFEGYFIKAKSTVLANAWYVHHDENIWGDPWTFRPERFLDEDGKLLPSSHVFMKSLIPFGTGRRRCPGDTLAKTRIFLYLATLLKKWTFLPVPGKCGSSDPRGGDFHLDITFKPKPFYCTVKKFDF